jgi:hypothetical protein
MLHTPFVSRSLLVAASFAIAASAPVQAQDEAALRASFEGRRVTVKIDMPGTSDGVDVHAGASRPVDFQRYGDRLKSYGTAIRAGESSTVTLVKLKKDLIEFQLGGGGFGTFGDDTSTSVNIPHVEKSKREKDLEREIKDEDDSRRKRRLESDLEDMQHARERENRRIDALRVEAEERKKERIADLRLRGGSRFNLRFEGSVPRELQAADVMAALSNFVDFSGETGARDDVRMAVDARTPGDALPRKGMLREDAEREFGRPTDASERREGSLTVVTLVFARPGQRITAEFVDDVLIRYSIASR